jgi:hypothetical protein
VGKLLRSRHVPYRRPVSNTDRRPDQTEEGQHAPSSFTHHCPRCDGAITTADVQTGQCTQCGAALYLWDLFVKDLQQIRDRRDRRDRRGKHNNDG